MANRLAVIAFRGKTQRKQRFLSNGNENEEMRGEESMEQHSKLRGILPAY
jgi:hypothetical protein